MNFEDFKQKVATAPALDFGDIFGKSFDLFKKVWVQGVVFMLMIFVISLPSIVLSYAPLFMTSGFGSIDIEDSPFITGGPSFGVLIAQLLFGIAVSTASIGLTAGFFNICKNASQNKVFGSNQLFIFFKKRYLVKMLVINLASIGIAILAALLFVLPLIYVSVPLSFVAAIFAFHPDWNTSQIIKAAFSIGNKKWLLSFGLLVVTGIIIYILIIVSCGLGIIFFTCFQYLPIFLIYNQVVGFQGENESGQIEIS